jgi:hypothetical protein
LEPPTPEEVAVFLFRLILLPPRLAFGTTRLGFKTARFLGIRRLFFVGIGVGIGLLIAPVPGAEMRERLRAFLEEQGLFEPATPLAAVAPSGNGFSTPASPATAPIT